VKSKNAVIFDWDLTLWNSWDLHVWLLRYTADILQVLQPKPEIVAQEYGVPFLLHLERVLNLPIERVLPVYMGMYDVIMPLKGHLYDGIKTTLQGLADHGIIMAIVSDKREPFGYSELKRTGLQDHFQFVSFLNAEREYKPSPSRLFEACENLELDRKTVLYIGDSHSDLQCAELAGIDFGAATWAALQSEAITPESKHVFPHPSHILSVVTNP
tara:strand:- start:24553 stop:25194 length:642 start_codon:yes stop_codon:yes gene_type:complete